MLQRGLGFAPYDVNCLFKLPGPRDIFETSFKNAQTLENLWNTYRQKATQLALSKFTVEALTNREVKVITVLFYNESVSDYDISLWLIRHGTLVSDVRWVYDEDGMWTGARKWLVRLHPDDTPPPIDQTLTQHHHFGTEQGSDFLQWDAKTLQHLWEPRSPGSSMHSY